MGDWYEAEAVWELPCRARERMSPSSGGEHRVEGEVVTAEVLKWEPGCGYLSWSTESRWCRRRAKERGKGSKPCSILDPVGFGSEKPLNESKGHVSLESPGREGALQKG